MQIPSGHCRCKKTQTPSRHEPKTAQTASQKTVSRYLWNPHIKQYLEPQSTSPAYANKGLCKHHLDTADAKRPKHHLDTSRKPPKPQAKKLFHVTFGIHIKQSIFGATEHMPSLMQTPSGHCRCKKTQTPSRHEPKTAQTASQKTVSRYLWNPHKTIFGATGTCANTSLCKHHLDTADAKRPKHHLDTSRKPPKPQAKKLFHVTFGIHIKQSLEPQSTCPAYANTIWNHIRQLWSHRAHAQPMQTPSGHCRCKKTQTPSRDLWNPHKTIFGTTEHMPSLCKHHLEPHKTTLEPQFTCPAYANTIWTLQMQKDPNTIKTRAENRPNRKPKNCFTLPLESPQTIFGATEHMPSLCKHHLDTADAKRPKHHLDTSRKPPKPQAKKLFHVAFGIHIKQSLEPQSTSPAYANTSLCKHHLDTADAKRPKHHLDTSRKPPKPQAKKLSHVTFGIHIKQSLEPQSTCPAYANTIWNHIKQLWSHRAHAQPMQTPSGHCRCKKTQTPSRHEPKTAQTASQKTVSRYL